MARLGKLVPAPSTGAEVTQRGRGAVGENAAVLPGPEIVTLGFVEAGVTAGPPVVGGVEAGLRGRVP